MVVAASYSMGRSQSGIPKGPSARDHDDGNRYTKRSSREIPRLLSLLIGHSSTTKLECPRSGFPAFLPYPSFSLLFEECGNV